MTFILRRHAPAHLFLDGQTYFFTGAVYMKRPLIDTESKKRIFTEILFRFHDQYGWELREWVVLDNHYHFLSAVSEGRAISGFINSLHKTSAFHIQRESGVRVKPFWYQYWDRCIRDEADFNRTATYILYNPVKHGRVTDLKEYPFSSFGTRHESDPQKLRDDFLRHKPGQSRAFDGMDDF